MGGTWCHLEGECCVGINPLGLAVPIIRSQYNRPGMNLPAPKALGCGAFCFPVPSLPTVGQTEVAAGRDRGP